MNPFEYIKSDEDFHEQRAKRIGSSDIPVLAGLYTHWNKTPVTLWMEKTGRAESFQGNEKTKWGNHLEPLVLREFLYNRLGELPENNGYFSKYNRKIRSINKMVSCHMKKKPYGKNGIEIMTTCVHPKYDFAVAHADMINTRGDNFIKCPHCGNTWAYKEGTTKECYSGCGFIIQAPLLTIPYIVEAKTTGFYAGKRREKNDFGWSKDDHGEGGIPAAVYLQIQWQMFVYGINACWSAALIDTSDYNEYGIIYANKSVQEKMLAMAANFNDCIIKDVPPPPTTFKDIGLLFPKNNKTTIIISGEQLEKVEAMKEEKKKLEEKIKTNTKKIDEIKTAVGGIIGENEVLGSPEGKTIGKNTRIAGRKTVSLPNIKKLNPEIYQELEDSKQIKIGKGYSRLSF